MLTGIDSFNSPWAEGKKQYRVLKLTSRCPVDERWPSLVRVPWFRWRLARLPETRQPSVAGAGEPLHYVSLHDMGRRIAAGEISPTELTRYMLERIAKVGLHCNIATDLSP